MYELFARDRATGQRSMTAAERVQQWTSEQNVHVQDINSETEEDAINLEGLSDAERHAEGGRSSLGGGEITGNVKVRYRRSGPRPLEGGLKCPRDTPKKHTKRILEIHGHDDASHFLFSLRHSC